MNVLLIFGGKSTEYEVSCASAASVLENIKGHNVIKCGVTKNGEWYITNADSETIKNCKWPEENNIPLSIDLEKKAFMCKGEKLVVDTAFPLIHGRNGEDGRLQGLLEMLEIPYVGAGVLGSAVCMDKITANRLFDHAGIPHTEWFHVLKHEYETSPEAIIEKADKFDGYPLFIKPSNAGSSVGISKCKDRSELKKAFDIAFENDTRVLVEKGVDAVAEIEISILGNDEPIASVTGKILPANDFYDYEAKYVSEGSLLYIPSGIDEKTEAYIRKTAIEAYKVCDCKGLSRIDFLMTADGKVYLNEINTLPGFTKISMYPKNFVASGIEYSELIDRLLGLSLEGK